VKRLNAWLRAKVRAWLGIDVHEEAIGALSPIAVSVHRRLSHYERTVPAIQKVALATQVRHLREVKKAELGEASSGEVA
jgi:hypothetical protein